MLTNEDRNKLVNMLERSLNDPSMTDEYYDQIKTLLTNIKDEH